MVRRRVLPGGRDRRLDGRSQGSSQAPALLREAARNSVLGPFLLRKISCWASWMPEQGTARLNHSRHSRQVRATKDDTFRPARVPVSRAPAARRWLRRCSGFRRARGWSSVSTLTIVSICARSTMNGGASTSVSAAGRTQHALLVAVGEDVERAFAGAPISGATSSQRPGRGCECSAHSATPWLPHARRRPACGPFRQRAHRGFPA